MKFYFTRRAIAGFFFAILVIGFLTTYIVLNNRRAVEDNDWVTHTNEVLFQIEQLRAITVNLESAQRGYSITGNNVYLAPYRTSSDEINAHARNLRRLTVDNPVQQQLIGQLERELNHKMAFNKKVIEARGIDFGQVQQLHATLAGKYIMDSINVTLEQMRAHEQNLLIARSDKRLTTTQNSNYAYIVLLAVTLITLLTVFFSINSNLHARDIAEKKAVEISNRVQDIYNNAPCGYHALDENGVFIEINKTWLEWLQYSRHEIVNKLKITDIVSSESVEVFRQNYPQFKKTGSIRDVEFEVVRKDKSKFHVLISSVAEYDANGNYVNSRSTAFDYTDLKMAKEKVMATNMELEAFTYSVSHDLRAPLRSIDGYSRILLEDYGAAFDDNARRILNVVMNNARRMGQLIDDLLDFSRIGRKEIARMPIDAEQMVRAICNELLHDERHRTVELQIGHLPTVWVDAHLFKQVWVNLLSNAVKYTNKRDTARVEVNAHENEEGEVVFSVKDNGAGFDMKYVHKLFGVFQRLHRAQEFEGTGVGLAIVHRIITRHGGRVWAEGKINEGAVFYFSIPHANQ